MLRPQETPLLSSIYKPNPHQESLGGYRRFCKFHSIKHLTSGKNFRKKDSGVPNESERVWRKGRIHRRPYPAVVKGGPCSLPSLVPHGKNRSLISCAFGEAIVAQALTNPINLSPVREWKIEWQNDTHSNKSIAI